MISSGGGRAKNMRIDENRGGGGGEAPPGKFLHFLSVFHAELVLKISVHIFWVKMRIDEGEGVGLIFR